MILPIPCRTLAKRSIGKRFWEDRKISFEKEILDLSLQPVRKVTWPRRHVLGYAQGWARSGVSCCAQTEFWGGKEWTLDTGNYHSSMSANQPIVGRPDNL